MKRYSPKNSIASAALFSVLRDILKSNIDHLKDGYEKQTSEVLIEILEEEFEKVRSKLGVFLMGGVGSKITRLRFFIEKIYPKGSSIFPLPFAFETLCAWSVVDEENTKFLKVLSNIDVMKNAFDTNEKLAEKTIKSAEQIVNFIKAK